MSEYVDYKSYITGKAWKEKRSQFYGKAKYACAKQKKCFICCRKNLPLDLHHITYKRLSKEHLSDLRPLCRECHEVVHKHPDGIYNATFKLKRQFTKRASKKNMWGRSLLEVMKIKFHKPPATTKTITTYKP